MCLDKIFCLRLVLIDDETYFIYEYKQTQIYITKKSIIFNWTNKSSEKAAS